MPFVSGLSTATTVAGNAMMVNAFLGRVKQQVHPKLSRPFTSVRMVEPIPFAGAVPPMALFTGYLGFKGLPSFTIKSPNLLWKNGLDISLSQFEGDQVGYTRRLPQAMGIELANLQDRILASRILRGSSDTTVVFDFDGQTYNLTMDGLAFFSTAHTLWSGGTQSNIISGNLPATAALFLANDMKTNANKMVQDLQSVINTVMTVKNNQGQPIYPQLEPGKQLVVVIPPLLQPAAALAFSKLGAPVQIIDATTGVGQMYVKEVIPFGLLAGFTEPLTDTNYNPLNATDYYVFVVDDYVSPFYTHAFRPLKGSEMFPPDYDPEAVANGMMAALDASGEKDVSEAAVSLFAGSRIDTNIGAIGANAQRDVVAKESFFVSARHRGNVMYGPWFTAYRIKAYGGS